MKTNYLYALAVMLLLVVLVGCSGKEETSTGPTPVSGARTSAPSMPGMEGMNAQTVNVDLTEWSITFKPTTAKAGMIHFEVKNSGTTIHSLTIKENGVNETLKDSLNPGDTGMLMATLKAGTYDAYCPIGKHADQGMKAKLKVE